MPYRDVAENAWRDVPNQPHARHVTLDEWVLMPNHLHGIIVLGDLGDECAAGRGEAAGREILSERGTIFPAASPLRADSPYLVAGSVGAIVGNFKSLVTRRVNHLRRTPGAKVWQRGYYDRIVRNDRELDAIRRYIRDNPDRWDEDRDNLDALVAKMRNVT